MQVYKQCRCSTAMTSWCCWAVVFLNLLSHTMTEPAPFTLTCNLPVYRVPLWIPNCLAFKGYIPASGIPTLLASNSVSSLPDSGRSLVLIVLVSAWQNSHSLIWHISHQLVKLSSLALLRSMDYRSWMTAKSVSGLWKLTQKFGLYLHLEMVDVHSRFQLYHIKTYVNCVCAQSFINCASNTIP